MMLTLSSTFHSAHFYNQASWSEEQNKSVFDRCFTKYGHGHNYKLQVKFYVTSSEYSQDEVKYSLILKKMTDVLDHQHLNFDIAEFKTQIPTTENIALYFVDKLKSFLPLEVIHSVKLYETETLWTEIVL